LDADARQRLLAILSRSAGESRSLWDQVKREPKRSTVPQFKDSWIAYTGCNNRTLQPVLLRRFRKLKSGNLQPRLDRSI
jgi:hypothetical protein